MKKKFITCVILTLLLFVFGVAASAAEPVRIAVIDTGAASLAIDPANIVQGKNYILPDRDTEDLVGHGTAISAIIVGSGSAGIEGLCPDALIVPLVWYSKNDDGFAVRGKASMTAQAIRDAIDLYGCRVINLSAGSTGNDIALKRAVAYAEEKGVLIVSCAGNDGTSGRYYPGAYDTVLCVGSCDADGTAAADFSNANDTVDLLAPGQDLQIATIQGGTATSSGTSFSSAYVAAAAARLLMEDPGLTPAHLRAILCETAVDIGPVGYDTASGWGVLDLNAALARLSSPAVSEKPAQPETPAVPAFSDVAQSDWFCSGVNWAVERGITAGTSATTFSPARTCSYGEILTFLWRAQGSPQPAIENPYTHMAVREEQYYYIPLLWAWEAGVVDDAGLDPSGFCSRSDVVTYLWRLAGSPETGSPDFTDVLPDAPYARAVSWAVERGITSGTGEGCFSPDMTCTRGQIVVFLQKFFAGQIL